MTIESILFSTAVSYRTYKSKKRDFFWRDSRFSIILLQFFFHFQGGQGYPRTLLAKSLKGLDDLRRKFLCYFWVGECKFERLSLGQLFKQGSR